jgi:phenylpropionate dioxygenase-like ring-hydroxylating dioxygenase large terminal subunit
MQVTVRDVPEPSGIRTATTLPAAWYADPGFFERERQRVFGIGWVCAGVTDELPSPGSWRALTVAGTPVLLVRDRLGVLRGFLNVCRHRAAPLCDDGAGGDGPLLRCPYHAWLYRLDGSLAKAHRVGQPDGFDIDSIALTAVGVATWRRFVFVHLADSSAAFDLGPLAAAIDACPIEEMEPALHESDVRAFNWKVLIENYSENYHTPFVHPEIDTSSTEDYPMVSDGAVLYAWDRVLEPTTDHDRLRAELLPGEPGWDRTFAVDPDRPYGVGSYLTVWPNLMINAFPDAVLAMWVQPTGPTTTLVERRLYLRADCGDTQTAAIMAAHGRVHQQDVDICLAVQRSHDAGLDANGVLSTIEEHGVHFVHSHLRAALA